MRMLKWTAVAILILATAPVSLPFLTAAWVTGAWDRQ